MDLHGSTVVRTCIKSFGTFHMEAMLFIDTELQIASKSDLKGSTSNRAITKSEG